MRSQKKTTNDDFYVGILNKKGLFKNLEFEWFFENVSMIVLFLDGMWNVNERNMMSSSNTVL